MRIVAFNTSHDSSVCAIVDGQLEFFCKEERLSRRKRDSFPMESLLTYAGLALGPVDHTLYLTPTDSPFEFFRYQELFGKKSFSIFQNLENFSTLTHHQCHAMLAHVNSRFDESLVFVIDRNGSFYVMADEFVARESESIYYFNQSTHCGVIRKNFWCEPDLLDSAETIEQALRNRYRCKDVHVSNPYSIVKVYEAATTLIGQDQLENGKTMGLSSYGKYSPMGLFGADGQPSINKLEHRQRSNGDSKVIFAGWSDRITQEVDPKNYQHYADAAKAVQVETQQAVLDLIDRYVAETGVTNVCLVGGYGLNVVANNFYISQRPDIRFYFEPISDDTGIPIGACWLRHKQITGEYPKPLADTFFHYYDTGEQIDQGQSASIDQLVDLLCGSGQGLGIFDGAPEAGPRALGHRSILFDPRNPDGKHLVNRIKKREWYRPFAAVILQEHFSEWFHTQGLAESKNMTVNFFIREHLKDRVPAVVHADLSCRIQTVDQEAGFLYLLLKAFYERTGCPLLLNTSLNLAGEPLVQTKQDALGVIKNSQLGHIYFVDQQMLVSANDLGVDAK